MTGACGVCVAREGLGFVPQQGLYMYVRQSWSVAPCVPHARGMMRSMCGQGLKYQLACCRACNTAQSFADLRGSCTAVPSRSLHLDCTNRLCCTQSCSIPSTEQQQLSTHNRHAHAVHYVVSSSRTRGAPLQGWHPRQLQWLGSQRPQNPRACSAGHTAQQRRQQQSCQCAGCCASLDNACCSLLLRGSSMWLKGLTVHKAGFFPSAAT